MSATSRCLGEGLGHAGQAELNRRTLLRVDAAGRKCWLMQAGRGGCTCILDRVRHVRRAIDVDADPLPDVVLEVDHTTDVRKRKLGIYKERRVPRDLGAGAVGGVGAQAGAGHSCTARRGVSGGGGEPGVSGVAGGGDSPCADRGPAV